MPGTTKPLKGENFYASRRYKVTRLALIFSVVALLALSVWAVWPRNQEARPDGYEGTNSAKLDQAIESWRSATGPDGKPITQPQTRAFVGIFLNSVNIADGSVSGRLVLELDPNPAEYETPDLKELTSRDQLSEIAGGSSAKVELSGDAPATTVEYPLREAFSLDAHYQGTDGRTVEVPLVFRDAANFPNDSYKARVNATVTLPEGVYIHSSSRSKRSSVVNAPVFFRADPALSDWSIEPASLSDYYDLSSSEAVDVDFPPQGTVTTGGSFTLRHSGRLVVYIYLISAIPVLLGIALVSRRSSRNRSGEASPLELAAAMLALITLRQVLVPPDISSITRLDKLLGLEVVAMIALSVSTYLIAGTRGKKTFRFERSLQALDDTVDECSIVVGEVAVLSIQIARALSPKEELSGIDALVTSLDAVAVTHSTFQQKAASAISDYAIGNQAQSVSACAATIRAVAASTQSLPDSSVDRSDQWDPESVAHHQFVLIVEDSINALDSMTRAVAIANQLLRDSLQPAGRHRQHHFSRLDQALSAMIADTKDYLGRASTARADLVDEYRLFTRQLDKWRSPASLRRRARGAAGAPSA